MSEINKRENVVEVVRYIRDFNFWDESISNMYGITIVYTLDYEQNTVFAKWSVCNNENFDKKEGRLIAKERKNGVLFDMDNIKVYGSLTKSLVVELEHLVGEPLDVDMADYAGEYFALQDLFLKAFRKLSK